MGKDNLGRHAAENEGEGEAEEDEVVVRTEVGVRGIDPTETSTAECEKRDPFVEDWSDREVVFAASFDDVFNAIFLVLAHDVTYIYQNSCNR